MKIKLPEQSAAIVISENGAELHFNIKDDTPFPPSSEDGHLTIAIGLTSAINSLDDELRDITIKYAIETIKNILKKYEGKETNISETPIWYSQQEGTC